MATIKRRGRTWQLNWSDANGRHRKSLGKISQQEADIKRREKELELRTGRRYGTSGVRFLNFASEYLSWYEHQYPSTYDRTEGIFRLSLTPFFGEFDLDDIQVSDTTAWMAERRAAKKSPGTITKEARALHAILRKAVRWKRIESNPLADFEPPPERASKAPQFYTKAQLSALYGASALHHQIWRFMVNTGLRRNEALYLKLGDVSEAAVTVQSEQDRPTKARRFRSVPLNDAAKAAVEALRAASKSDYLLPRVTPPSLSRAFVTCATRASLPGSVHTLRHTFISHLVMAGADLGVVKELAGHSTIATTMRYAHLAAGHAQSAVAKVNL